MTFRIGILGATGYIGTPYRKEIRESDCDATIVALCARRQDRLKAAAREDNAELATDRWEEVVEHPDVNLVMVLTPDALHYEPVMRSIALGKHVFCEKPIGKNAQEATSMQEAAKRSNIVSFVPFWTRFIPAFIRAKQIVAQGDLGDIRGVIYRWHNPRPIDMPFTWRDDTSVSSAGSIADVGSHAYDTIRYVLGVEAVRVLTHASVVMPPKPDAGQIDLQEALNWNATHAAKASAARDQAPRKGTAPDYAQIAVEFDNGAVGSILLSHASYIRKGFAPELELHGTKASLSVDRFSNQLRIADSTEVARDFEQHESGHCNRFEQFVFPALTRRISGQPCTAPDLYDGWRVQLFTDAALRSSLDGRWVDLSEMTKSA